MGHVDVDYERGADADADTAEGLSGFWGDCPIVASVENIRKAYGYIEDGHGVPEIIADGPIGVYEVEVTATGTPKFGSMSSIGGGLRIVTGTADNDELIAVYGGNSAASFRISDATTEKSKLWFEVSVLPTLITATQSGAFFGLCETFAGAAAGLIEDDGTIDPARDLIGFFKREGDAGLVDFIYQKGSQTIQILLNGYKTLNTTTPVKLGFKYDPTRADAEQITIYTDGIPESTFVTATLIAAADPDSFPDAVAMTPTFNVKNATGAAQTWEMKFWGCYQERV